MEYTKAALPKRHKVRYMEAHRSRTEGEDTDLEFKIGDFIVVLDDTGDMWEVVCGNKCGFMPKDVLEPADNRRSKKDPFPAMTLFAYTGEDSTEITAPEKSSLIVVDVTERGWWRVIYGNRTGWFPSNYGAQCGYTSKEIRARVLSSYSPKEAGHLRLKKGDMIRVLGDEPPNMFSGHDGTNVGLFPSSCVELLEEDGTERLIQNAVVVQDYKPQFKNEVAVSKDDEIKVLNENDNGWYVVVNLQKKMGRVPAEVLRISDLPTPVHDSTFAVAKTDIDGMFNKGQVLMVHTKHTASSWSVYQNATNVAWHVRSVDVEVIDFCDEERDVVPMRANRDLMMKDPEFLSFKKGDTIRVFKETPDGILVGATKTDAGFVHKEDLEPLGETAFSPWS